MSEIGNMMSAGGISSGGAEWARQKIASGQLGQWLYRPQEVWPYLRQVPRPSPLSPAPSTLLSLSVWITEEVTLVPGSDAGGRPDRWQSPAETLWQGTGCGEEMALVLWCAAPLWGLPQGQLVVGTLMAEAHAWVEFPEIGLYADVAAGRVAELCALPSCYRPALRIYPSPPA